MRRGYNQKEMGFLTDDDGKLIVASLGADHCAEHEWGIDKIHDAFQCGCTEEERNRIVGIDRYRIREYHPDLKMIERDDWTALIFSSIWRHDSPDDYELHSELTPYKSKKHKENFVGAWSERDFGIYADDDEGRGHLRELNEAFQNKDVAIWLGGKSGPFKNAGLMIGIVSRIPKDANDQMAATHKEWIHLEEVTNKVEQETKLQEKLRDAECRYYACSSRLIEDAPGCKNKVPTNYPIVYWLNPMDQKNNRYGWVSVEDLLAWANGNGPIPTPTKDDERGGVQWHIEPEDKENV